MQLMAERGSQTGKVPRTRNSIRGQIEVVVIKCFHNGSTLPFTLIIINFHNLNIQI